MASQNQTTTLTTIGCQTAHDLGGAHSGGGVPELIESRLDEPLRLQKAARIGVQLMGDLFHEEVPDTFINRIFVVMIDKAPAHTFLVLTKRPRRMCYFLQITRWMDRGILEGLTQNVWLGVTAENQEQADLRIPELLRIRARGHFVSIEPMLGPVDLRDLPINENTHVNALTGRERFTGAINGFGTSTGLHLAWVIIGGESGPGARRMDCNWALDTMEQCKVAGVPVFVKQLGTAQGLDNINGADMSEWPEALRVRQWPVLL